jgi:hypothetical protein
MDTSSKKQLEREGSDELDVKSLKTSVKSSGNASSGSSSVKRRSDRATKRKKPSQTESVKKERSEREKDAPKANKSGPAPASPRKVVKQNSHHKTASTVMPAAPTSDDEAPAPLSDKEIGSQGTQGSKFIASNRPFQPCPLVFMLICWKLY